MSITEKYELTSVINARGAFTPLGVSRSPEAVTRYVSEMLGQFVRIDELQNAASDCLVELSGAEAGAVVHCSAAAITLAIAACMTQGEMERVKKLPDTTGFSSRVLLLASHNVNYGHQIEQAVRLAGATPVLIGSEEKNDLDALEAALAQDDICCVLLVSSRLTRGAQLDLNAAVSMAARTDIPIVIDGAAQDMRVRELVATGADLVIISGQKYLCGPTAGLVVGSEVMVEAVRAQEQGIGRAMKASKEAIAGTLAALELRQELILGDWHIAQRRKLARFLRGLSGLPGATISEEPDPTGLPFSRAVMSFEYPHNAAAFVEELRASDPPIYVMDHAIQSNKIIFEINALCDQEIELILARLKTLLT